MPSEELPIPGARDVQATLDSPDDADPDAVVVACPPHPQFGGHRGDARLTAVSEALVEAGASSDTADRSTSVVAAASAAVPPPKLKPKIPTRS